MTDKTLTEKVRKQLGINEKDSQEDKGKEEIRAVDVVRALAHAESAILDAKWMATFQDDTNWNRIVRAFEDIHMARVDISYRISRVPKVHTITDMEHLRIKDEWEFNKGWYRKLESDAEKLAENLAKLRNDLNGLTFRSRNHTSIHKQICMIEIEMLILQESIKTAHKEMERRI